MAKMFYKSEVARLAGVSTRTLQRWMAAHRDKLLELGYDPKAKFLHPRALMYVCEEYCIDLDPPTP